MTRTVDVRVMAELAGHSDTLEQNGFSDHNKDEHLLEEPFTHSVGMYRCGLGINVCNLS